MLRMAAPVGDRHCGDGNRWGYGIFPLPEAYPIFNEIAIFAMGDNLN